MKNWDLFLKFFFSQHGSSYILVHLNPCFAIASILFTPYFIAHEVNTVYIESHNSQI